jgi:hypothetical protein
VATGVWPRRLAGVANMIVDDCLFATIIAGIGLSGAYLRAVLVLHRRTTALQRAKELVQREVHAERVRIEPNKILQPVPSIQANAFRLVRVLARALRIFIQDRSIHRFRIRT